MLPFVSILAAAVNLYHTGWNSPKTLYLGLERPNYKDIFTRYRVLEPGDARDKIFAFLGLRPGGMFSEALRPTYTGDKTAGAVYTAATKYLIETDLNLDILLCHRESRNPLRSQDVSSLMPKYEVNYIYSIGGSLTNTSSPWSAAGDRSYKTSIAFSESNSLPVRGYRIDVIKSEADADLSELDEVALLLAHVGYETASRAMEDISASESTEEPEHKGKNVLSDCHAVRNQQTRCEILWRTLLADTIKVDRPAPTNRGEAFAYTLYKRLKLLSGLVKHERLAASNSRRYPTDEEEDTASSKFIRFVEAVEILEAMERQDCGTIQSIPSQLGIAAPVLTAVLSDFRERLLNSSEVKDMSMPPAIPEFWKRINQVEKERSLFVTENHGYLGCGPAALEPGDQIWLLEDATVPFVVRPILQGDFIQRFE
ncbi:hypothetical protein MBLNU13_g04715t4 [Cladosporium sp. NU13]